MPVVDTTDDPPVSVMGEDKAPEMVKQGGTNGQSTTKKVHFRFWTQSGIVGNRCAITRNHCNFHQFLLFVFQQPPTKYNDQVHFPGLSDWEPGRGCDGFKQTGHRRGIRHRTVLPKM